DAKQRSDRMNVAIIAIIQAVKTIRTKRGDRMAFITLNDETDDIEAVAFPDLYRKTSKWLREEMFVTAHGQIEIRNDRKQVLLHTIEPFDEANLQQPEHLFIKLTNQSRDRKSTRLNSSHVSISYAVFCLKKKTRTLR